MAGKLQNYHVVLGVCGGIAAYKSAALCSMLVKHGADVSVMMTEHARQFVTALTFSSLTRKPVYESLFVEQQVYDTEHISLAQRADLIVIAPATANIIGKLANGICDDLLSTVLCAADSPVLLAPAMNNRMWEHPATMDNVGKLQRWGYAMVGPESGRLACGDNAVGRMSEPESILERVTVMLEGVTPKETRG